MKKNDDVRQPRLRVLVLLAGVRGACSGLARAVLTWLIEQAV